MQPLLLKSNPIIKYIIHLMFTYKERQRDPYDVAFISMLHYGPIVPTCNFLTVFWIPAENLKAMLSSPACSTPSSLTPDSDTDSEFPSSLVALMQTSSDSETSPESTEAGEGSELHMLHPPLLQKTDAKNVDLKVFSSFRPVATKV